MRYWTAVYPFWKWFGKINYCPAGRSARIRLSLSCPDKYANIRLELNFSNSDPQALRDELLHSLCSAVTLSRTLNTLDLIIFFDVSCGYNECTQKHWVLCLEVGSYGFQFE